MTNITWQFNGARIETHQLTVKDELDAEVTADILRDGRPHEHRDWYRRDKFSEFIHSSKIVDGSLGFDLPDPYEATLEELQAAFEAWGNLKGLLGQWRAALLSIEAEKK